MKHTSVPLVTTLAAGALLVGTISTTAAAAPSRDTSGAGSTSSSAATATPSESSKLDKVATPRLGWFSCYGGVRCATVKVPLDYDQPKGATTELAVLKVPATGTRKGTLFVNPGGPGGSATEFAYGADFWASSELRKNFDIIGVDPRGIGFSDNVQCLQVKDQDSIFANLEVGVPYGYLQEVRWNQSMKKVSTACSTNRLATSMSTAEVARDMEMVRRALGEDKLSYLGFSYGSHLGTTYANMFPQSFRSIAVDGTLNPVAWSGTAANQSKPLDFRLNSGKGAAAAMKEILKQCRAVGPDRCDFAAGGDPQRRYDALMARFKKGPVTVEDPFTGETVQIGYGEVVNVLLGDLYTDIAPLFVTWDLASLEELVGDSSARRTARALDPTQREHRSTLTDRLDEAAQDRPTRGFPYDNGLDAFLSVTCTDSRETTKIDDYRRYAKQADVEAPEFGRAWLFSSSGCAGDSFTGQDEDAYVGPYNRPTTKAVLIVGNYWDPATAYTGAVETRGILGRSRLVSSDSWGHTAYGISQCVTKRVDTYLISGSAPLRDATCPAETEAFPAFDEEEEGTVLQKAAKRPLPAASSTAKGAARGFSPPTVVR